MTIMKKCPHCAESIQDEAKVCRYCQREVVARLDPLPKDAPVKKSNAGRWVLLFLLGACVLGWMLKDVPPPGRAVKSFVQSQRDTGDQIELLASRGFQSSDSYKRVEGQVKNLTSDAFRSVTAVVSWFDKDDRFISSDSALVDYRPLLPGQVSPFSVLVASNPEMKSFRVEFTVSGRPLTIRRSDLK